MTSSSMSGRETPSYSHVSVVDGADTPKHLDAKAGLVSSALACFENVVKTAYDPEVVKALAGSTSALRTYFEHADSLAATSLNEMVAFWREVVQSGVIDADDVARVSDGVATIALGPKGPAVKSQPCCCSFPSGYCYLSFVDSEHFAEAVKEFGEWPTVHNLLCHGAHVFDLSSFVKFKFDAADGCTRAHVVRAEGVEVALVQLVTLVREQSSWFPAETLGSVLSRMNDVRPLAGHGLDMLTCVGGTGSDDPAYHDVSLARDADHARTALVNVVADVCGVPAVDRSYAWEALQLAGNGVTEVDGRVLKSGNKLLAMVGDAALRLAFVNSCAGMRVGDAQDGFSQILSNGTLARVGRIWGVPPLLQGSLPGGASDTVVATAVEAIAGACYHGGGMDLVVLFLKRLVAFSGLGARYPWLKL